MSNKFKTDFGVYLTKALFFEVAFPKDYVQFTLKNEDHLGYPSLKRLFLETEDPSGYTLAVTYLDGWEHFCKLSECPWFQPYWTAWTQELEVSMRANALLRLIEESKNKNSKSYVELNRMLLNKGWVLPEERTSHRKRGAPTKQEVKDAAKEMAFKSQILDEDADRVFGGKVN